VRLSADDHRSTAQQVNQPEIHTERFLGPKIKVPLLPWVPDGEPLVGPRIREPVFLQLLPRQRPEGGCM